MKTLELTDEQYNMLVEFKNELLTQNNRSTRDPIFCIMDIREIPTDSDYASDFRWIDFDGDYCKIDHDDLFDHLNKHDDISRIIDTYNDEEDKEVKLDSITEDELKVVKQWFYDDLDYSCDENLDRFGFKEIRKVWYLLEQFIVENAPHSFFEKDAIEHLKSNHYHYQEKAITYACCNWRAPRMEKLREFLMNMNVGEK